MNSLLLMAVIILVGGPLAFALSRIAIRLRQAPSLAALASVLICWQMIALTAGRAALASSVMLLIGASAIIILVQWLRHEGALGGLARAGLLILTGIAWAIAVTYPVLRLEQALVFSGSFLTAAAGTWFALRWARNPVSLGKSGLPALGLLGLWLIVRVAASFIAAAE